MSCSTVLSTVFSYQTIKLVAIRNWKVALVYRLIQVAVLAYVGVFALYLRGGYQDSSEVIGDVTVKVKGMGFVNNDTLFADDLAVIGATPEPWQPGDKVYDAMDLVVPPMEPASVFVTTALLTTNNQSRGECSGNDKSTEACTGPAGVDCAKTPAKCSCAVGQYTRNGFVADAACRDNGFCTIAGWCPFEEDDGSRDIVHGSGEFTVFARATVRFPRYPGIIRNNANNTDTDAPTPGYNLFRIKDVVTATGTKWTDAIKANGIVVGAFSRWDCDFDKDFDLCQPSWSFVRLDDPKSTFSSGINFREVNKYYLPNSEGGYTEYRDLTKRFGVRIQFIITGEGRRFNVVSTLTNLGAGIGLLSVATLVADILLQHCVRRKQVYRENKYQEVEEPEDERLPLLS